MRRVSKQKMQTLYVELESTRYPVYVGSGLLEAANLILPHIIGKQVMLVSDTVVSKHYLPQVKNILTDKQCDVVILPHGEQYKTLATANQIFDQLLSQKHARSTTLLALGGGVVGDITGFAAACYMRGVSFIQLPTTLLAQVDAAIGGKTAVNHPLGKNMIGAFHQPCAVVADLDTLQTLPNRLFCEGLAEVIKYGLIQDADFFSWLENNLDEILLKRPLFLQQMIFRCCEIKASLVAADEKEQGVRALLNFGHTFGHAIEKTLGYGKLFHGEAVAVGMLMAADLSARLALISWETVRLIEQLLLRIGLPTKIPDEVSAAQLLEAMKVDKKNVNLTLRFVLLKAIGEAVITEDVPLDKLQQTLKVYVSKP